MRHAACGMRDAPARRCMRDAPARRCMRDARCCFAGACSMRVRPQRFHYSRTCCRHTMHELDAAGLRCFSSSLPHTGRLPRVPQAPASAESASAGHSNTRSIREPPRLAHGQQRGLIRSAVIRPRHPSAERLSLRPATPVPPCRPVSDRPDLRRAGSSTL